MKAPARFGTRRLALLGAATSTALTFGVLGAGIAPSFAAQAIDDPETAVSVETTEELLVSKEPIETEGPVAKINVADSADDFALVEVPSAAGIAPVAAGATLLQVFKGGSVTISGTKAVGSTLTANPKTFTPTPKSYQYKWFREGKVIAGKTGKTYKLTAVDYGKKISVQVVAVKPGYKNLARTSAKTSKILANGTWQFPLAYGSIQNIGPDVTVKVGKPRDVTNELRNTLLSSESWYVSDKWYEPKPGNAYWIAEVSVSNQSLDTITFGDWQADHFTPNRHTGENHNLMFRKTTGSVFNGDCPWYDLAYGFYPSWASNWGDIGRRTVATRYFCVEAPANALSTGMFAMTNFGSPQFFYK